MDRSNVLLDNAGRKAAESLTHMEARVRSTVTDVDAAAVFSAYSLGRLVGIRNDGPGEHPRPAPAAVELAAWVLYPEFGRSACRDGERIQAALDVLQEYERAFTLAELFPAFEEDDPFDELTSHLRIHSGMVRGSAYPSQIVRRINGIMRPLEEMFSDRVGVGPCRASEILRAVADQVEDNVNRLCDAFRELVLREQALAKKGTSMTEGEQAQLAACRDELRQATDRLEGEWVPTRAHVAHRLGGMTHEEWDALARIIGLTSTSRAAVASVVDVQDRPLFFLSAERAFCLHSVTCFDAIFTYFDDLARNDPSIRDRYGRLVAEWMETELANQLRRLFPATSVLRSACFPDPDNPGGETEADVVVCWGPFLLVAEAKGKRLAREAMRGSRARLRRTVSDNIQDAFIQSQRVLRILERVGEITFKEKGTGRKVEVRRDNLRRVMPVSVTLQNFSGIATQLAVTQRLGLFKGNAYPWSVSIEDLDVITRFSGSPDVFLHYIERRTAHQAIQVGLHGDELDIFGQYLDNRLHPSLYEGRKELAGHSGRTMITFAGGDEAFAPFYMAEWSGERPPAAKVELKVPAPIQSVLDQLRQRSDDSARWIAFALLGLSHAALDRLAKALSDIRGKPAHAGRLLRITIREDDVVINVLAQRWLTNREFYRLATVRTRMEHYRARPRATLSIGIDQGDPTKPFEIAQWLDGAWEYDPVMERLLSDDRRNPRIAELPQGVPVPGRNAPCPCGSGKKFKRCCDNGMTFRRPA